MKRPKYFSGRNPMMPFRLAIDRLIISSYYYSVAFSGFNYARLVFNLFFTDEIKES
jgi:hypothetical protein